MVWILEIPLQKGLLRKGIPRIPHHRALNHQLTISWNKSHTPKTQQIWIAKLRNPYPKKSEELRPLKMMVWKRWLHFKCWPILNLGRGLGYGLFGWSCGARPTEEWWGICNVVVPVSFASVVANGGTPYQIRIASISNLTCHRASGVSGKLGAVCRTFFSRFCAAGFRLWTYGNLDTCPFAGRSFPVAFWYWPFRPHLS